MYWLSFLLKYLSYNDVRPIRIVVQKLLHSSCSNIHYNKYHNLIKD